MNRMMKFGSILCKIFSAFFDSIFFMVELGYRVRVINNKRVRWILVGLKITN